MTGMQKCLFFLLIISLSYSCKTTKENTMQPSIQEEVAKKDAEEETVPDHPAINYEPMGDCREDWEKRERLILKKDLDRIGKLKNATSGQIFVITQVDKNGYVTKVRIDELNTTVKKAIWRNMALEIVSGYEFEPDENAPKIQCGTVKFLLTTM